MVFDLVGKNLDDSYQPDAPSIFDVSINISGRTYKNLDEYLEACGLPKNTIRFSCSNRYWHTIWGFVQFASQKVDSEYKFLGTETDFEMGGLNNGHYINETLANSIVTCCLNGFENNLFDKYMDEYSVSDHDKSNYLDTVERFIQFCGKSGGFSIF